MYLWWASCRSMICVWINSSQHWVLCVLVCVFEMVNTFLEFVCPWPTKRQANCLSRKEIEVENEDEDCCAVFLFKISVRGYPSICIHSTINTEILPLLLHSDWFCTITTHLLHAYLFIHVLQSNHILVFSVKCFLVDFQRSSPWSSPCCWRRNLWMITFTCSRSQMSTGILRCVSSLLCLQEIIILGLQPYYLIDIFDLC